LIINKSSLGESNLFKEFQDTLHHAKTKQANSYSTAEIEGEN
jgi:hypothetical protein